MTTPLKLIISYYFINNLILPVASDAEADPETPVTVEAPSSRYVGSIAAVLCSLPAVICLALDILTIQQSYVFNRNL